MQKIASWEDFSFITDTGDRQRVQRLEQAFGVVLGARRGETMTVMRAQAEAVGEKFKTFQRLYYSYCKKDPATGVAKGVKAVADRRKQRRDRDSVHLAFEVFKSQFAEKNFESLKSAHGAFIRAFNNGLLIAYGLYPAKSWKEDHPNMAVPEHLHGYTPHGWTYENFERKWKTDPSRLAVLAWTRGGPWAAAKFVKDVIRSRYDEKNDRQLPGGAVYEWDDAWENLMVILKGQTGALRPMAFHCYDVGTGYHFDPYFKARHEKEATPDGRVARSNLTEQMFRMVFMAHMHNVGINRAGCLNVMEHATTAIRKNVQEQIKLIPHFGSLIKFTASGIVDKRAHEGMYLVLNGGGNPKSKSLVEGGHRVMQIEIANLPGNMGRDAAHRHESWDAMEKYTNKMLAECEKLNLSDKVRSLLRLPLMRFEDFVMAYGEVSDRLMDSVDHRLEGWVKYYKEEFKVPGDMEERWLPMDEFGKLPEGLQHLIVSNGLVRSRKMSRREAWATWAEDLIKVPAEEMFNFFDWEKDAKELTVTPKRTIEFEDREFYPNGKVVFDAIVRGRCGEVRELCPGEKVFVYINPLIDNGNRIWIAKDKQGGYFGMAVKTRFSAFWGDEASIKRAAGLKMADEAHLLAETRAEHKDAASQMILDHAHNRLILEAAQELDGRLPVEDETPRRRRVTQSDPSQFLRDVMVH